MSRAVLSIFVIKLSKKGSASEGSISDKELGMLSQQIKSLEDVLKKANMTVDQVDAIAVTYAPGLLGGLLVGGISEEVMMRLFFMSLIVFIIYKVFYKNKKEIPTKVFIIANIIAALLFAAGHLPSTATMKELTPVIIFRCFLFNGGLGLTFGYLYRKYGIGYAMIAHGFAHLISDILMIIFI